MHLYRAFSIWRCSRSVYLQRTGGIYRRLLQPLQSGPCMLVLILPTPGRRKTNVSDVFLACRVVLNVEIEVIQPTTFAAFDWVPGGIPPTYGYIKNVPPIRVWFSGRFSLKRVNILLDTYTWRVQSSVTKYPWTCINVFLVLLRDFSRRLLLRRFQRKSFNLFFSVYLFLPQ